MNALLRKFVAGVAAGALVLVAACGGGGSDGTSGTSGPQKTEAVYQGTIGGFGSVIVNGVRFDDKKAAVTIDDAPAKASALKLGMRAEVQGTVSEDSTSGTASLFNVETAVRGPVRWIDTTNGRFRIGLITVQADDKTVFEGADGVGTLKVGDWVEVHGSADVLHLAVFATRVEVQGPEDIGRVVLFGKATNVTATTFTLGDLTVDYSKAWLAGFEGGSIPQGALVRVRSVKSPVGNVLQATTVKALKAPQFLEGAPAAVEGRVQEFKGVSDFLVSGVAVDASQAEFVFGSAADLSEGKRVVVVGSLANGKVIAAKVRFYRSETDGEVRLIGAVTDYVSNASFKVRGVAVDASAAVFKDGDAAQLTNGRIVEVKGQSAGSVVKASKVEFEEVNLHHTLTGLVTDFVSTTDFKLAGQQVRIAETALFIGGTSANLGNGAPLWLTGVRDSAGTFTAAVVIFVPDLSLSPTQVTGVVSDVGADGSFKLNGSTVTISPATSFVGGTPAHLVAGTWVVVTGRVTGGVLAADVVAFPGRSLGGDCSAFKFEGVVYDYASASDFKLFGVTIDASTAEFRGGKAQDLANGRVVRACGNELPANGVATAAKIEFIR